VPAQISILVVVCWMLLESRLNIDIAGPIDCDLQPVNPECDLLVWVAGVYHLGEGIDINQITEYVVESVDALFLDPIDDTDNETTFY